MAMFRWNDWNLEHIARHGVGADEAEWVVRHPARSFPRKHRGGYLVWGRTREGRWLQVTFLRDRAAPYHRLYVYHARPLAWTEKRRIDR
jgi:hypothetical protein